MNRSVNILLATTNEGKRKEIERYFADLPVTIHSLESALPDHPPAPETTGTVEGNALQKAKYYASASGMLTLADDTGLFIDALDGWPGVDAALIADTPESRNKLILEKLSEKSMEERSAYFQSTIICYDPREEQMICATGILSGVIGYEPKTQSERGFGYDPIFIVKEENKTLAEMTIEHKNTISHRGKALQKMKHMLHNYLNVKHIVVPVGIVIKEGKMLINKRNDPANPSVHNKWEFPGGSMEWGEQINENLIREVKEETGYDVEVLESLSEPYVYAGERNGRPSYQVYLLPMACTVTGGSLDPNDAEVLESAWVSIDEALSMENVLINKQIIQDISPRLKTLLEQS